MTDSLFVSLCKRGCPYFHTGSLVHRWQVVFGSALLHRVHFWLMARLTSWRWLWLFPPLLYLYYDSATGDADWFTFRIFDYMYMYSAFGDVDWYSYYVSLHVCIPPLAMMTDHFPFFLLSISHVMIFWYSYMLWFRCHIHVKLFYLLFLLLSVLCYDD